MKNMKVGIDIRSLIEPKRSGVGEYTFGLLEALFKLPQSAGHQFFLFFNSFKNSRSYLPKWDYPNVFFCGFRYPNKFFNFFLKFFNWPKIDRLIAKKLGIAGHAPYRSAKGGSGTGLDIFLMPNLDFVALSGVSKKVLILHDLTFKIFPECFSLKSRLWHALVASETLIKNSDKIITVSENTRRDLSSLYNLEPSDITTIYPGVPETRQRQDSQKIREKYRLPEKFILYLGTIESRKNLAGLIKAFELLHSDKQFEDVHLVITGAFGYKAGEILKLAKKTKVSEKIKFLGYIAADEKACLYKLASLFVYPSLYEGFGFPPLEAQACGLPVAASRCSSLNEVLGNSALLFDPYNINEICQSIKLLLTNNILRQDLIRQGLENIKRFDFARTAEKILEIVQL